MSIKAPLLKAFFIRIDIWNRNSDFLNGGAKVNFDPAKILSLKVTLTGEEKTTQLNIAENVLKAKITDNWVECLKEVVSQ
jgi:hypothetical protein